MRLPRRVPWASVSELEQICAWIYDDPNDVVTKTLAINRLSAWRNITSLPHALESVLSLLSVILHDTVEKRGGYHQMALPLRQSYATAIIRLVNGLVDPLQSGAYARPIASIAAQLGLPSYLVELRHAATHEDLPSLEILREAATQSLTWLLHNYLIPTIAPASSPSVEIAPLTSVTPMLKKYKALVKTVIRDESLKVKSKHVLCKACRDIERWISEAMVVAGGTVGEYEWADRSNNDELDGKEHWALERLCDALLQKGALVPLSKKKRVPSASSFEPPALAVEIWEGLLRDVQGHHPGFAYVLSSRIVRQLTSETNDDPSYNACLARWAFWVVHHLRVQDDEDGPGDLIASLILSMGPAQSSQAGNRSAVLQLLQALCDEDPLLRPVVDLISRPASLGPWSGDDMTVMEERLRLLSE
ncbi:Las1-domain-containing protein, partial [Fistulina hepatica ATCC 64428]